MRGLNICSGSIRTIGFGWLLLLASLLSPFHASAAEYSWGWASQFQYPSPKAACDTWASMQSSYPRATGVLQPRTETYWLCLLRDSIGQFVKEVNINRSGDSCPPEHTLNTTDPDLPTCIPPESDPCEPTIGQIVEHRHRAGEFTAAGVIGGRTDPPGSVCKDMCQYAFTYEEPTGAYRFENGDPSGVFFKYKYRGNGVSCTGSENGFEQPSNGTPTGEKESDCTKKTTDANGVEVYECTRRETDTDNGKVDCNYGTANGETKCWPKTPSPKHTDKEVKTKVEEKTNPDGSKETKTTTTTTTTHCSGVGSCSTSTTTNVSNNKTNADGSDGGSSSSCEGPGCKKGGDGSETPTDEEETPASSVTGDSACQATPSCEGDAVQCAILRQTHKSRCDQEEFQSLDADKVTEAKGTLESEFAGEGYQPLAPGGEGTFALSDVLDTSSSISSSCPALPTLSFTIYGKSQTFSFSDWLAELCKVAHWLGYLMVAFAMRVAAEIIARGFA